MSGKRPLPAWVSLRIEVARVALDAATRYVESAGMLTTDYVDSVLGVLGRFRDGRPAKGDVGVLLAIPKQAPEVDWNNPVMSLLWSMANISADVAREALRLRKGDPAKVVPRRGRMVVDDLTALHYAVETKQTTIEAMRVVTAASPSELPLRAASQAWAWNILRAPIAAAEGALPQAPYWKPKNAASLLDLLLRKPVVRAAVLGTIEVASTGLLGPTAQAVARIFLPRDEPKG